MRILVTGSSSGIGLATCELLVRQGHEVCGVARRPSPAATRSIQADLAAPASVEVLEAITWADAVVLAAGKGEDQILTLETEAAMEEIIRLDLTMQLLLLRHCARLWLRRRHGQVVLVTSIAARTGMSGLVTYSAAKAGLEAAARAAARELGRYSIRVNCVAPGFIDTAMTASMPPERREQLARRSPLGRLGQPADVAQVVGSVLQMEWVTGQTFVVDGGFTA
jgi:3-oxoacyl-[acyl-carrier protein] reductase